jgi:hypothetical protein
MSTPAIISAPYRITFPCPSATEATKWGFEPHVYVAGVESFATARWVIGNLGLALCIRIILQTNTEDFCALALTDFCKLPRFRNLATTSVVLRLLLQ